MRRRARRRRAAPPSVPENLPQQRRAAGLRSSGTSSRQPRRAADQMAERAGLKFGDLKYVGLCLVVTGPICMIYSVVTFINAYVGVSCVDALRAGCCQLFMA